MEPHVPRAQVVRLVAVAHHEDAFRRDVGPGERGVEDLGVGLLGPRLGLAEDLAGVALRVAG